MTLNTENIENKFPASRNEKITKLEQALLLEECDPNILKNLADQHFKTGNYLRALNCYLKLLSFEPENAFTWNKIAVVFIKIGKFSSAMDMSRIAFRLINKEQNSIS